MNKIKPVAVVTGGSSGIGFACAVELRARGFKLVLAARSLSRLVEAKAQLLNGSSDEAGSVATIPLDVMDVEACRTFIETVERDHGPIKVLVCSAGIAEPGLFLDQALDSHIRQMNTNYLGTLGVVHAAAKPMARRRQGNIILVSSGAAFVGIYGYAAYAPSKFAVRGLAETLRAELAEHGVSVSLAYPPDTDTPQYVAEQATKPEVTKKFSEGGGLYSSIDVASRIIDKALKGHFVITHGMPLHVLRWVHSAYAPLFIRTQQAIARKLAAKKARRETGMMS